MGHAVAVVEDAGRRAGHPYPVQMTVATTNGAGLYVFRYSSEGRTRSLFHSADVSTLRAQYPDRPLLHHLSDDARIVVSEPLGSLRGAWLEVPEGSSVVIRDGRQTLAPFGPRLQHPVA